ncbi:cation:proton antiporter [Candidatus Kinetoplastidibacterium crithidiae]|uniref:CPA1 family monovalent cation:H+ antiporter n=1 Tax=Candidatus Kinetoplastidibacterium crithidiae TCC036E TaxID=1208918 RepID=M1LTP4_9PROT|nr:sodium:proton antiporter [Candidatus Kinetoplastibacterium crithidii]AFZ82465.1 monovalent cation:H+ antiporter, CPA1 family [Candidatus Kinetoplastibacterium crithidii (ex Angomonas deanei ATCC 30255)]AGF47476.1 CPA1 family monovalent cation:H+ antiporter [Candidatus Kinetoplastibacterium crithidii TCC036E]
MTLFDGAGALLSLIAMFGYINHRFIKLPDMLGITAVGLVASVCLLLLSLFYPEMVIEAQHLVGMIDFSELVFHGLLGLLLFAGALHVDISKMRRLKMPVFLLATIGVLISTAVVGVGFFLVTSFCNVPISFLWCLVFGALISPTDPIAVLAVLKNAKVSPDLETQIAGESLFNDGTAVVAFMTLLGLATGNTEFSLLSVLMTLIQEIFGAVIFGLVIGYVASVMLKDLDSYPVEILITLALSTAGYSIAEHLHVSAPLSVVVIGLVVGYNSNLSKGHKSKNREYLFSFWGLLDELLNLILFGLIGLKIVALSFSIKNLWLGIIAIFVVLIARYISVAAPINMLHYMKDNRHAVKIMTWGGLRGGISIALSLLLPSFEGREMFIGVTYVVVIFSLLVQATTLGPLVKFLDKKN